MEECLPWDGPYSGAGEECEEEGAAETTCDELTTTPFPVPLPCSEGGVRQIRSEIEPGKKGGMGERCLKI